MSFKGLTMPFVFPADCIDVQVFVLTSVLGRCDYTDYFVLSCPIAGRARPLMNIFLS